MKTTRTKRDEGRVPSETRGLGRGTRNLLPSTLILAAALMGALLVHHTDAEREWAYDRQSSIGRLDKALDEAKQRGWTVVSMKDDWKRIFPFESK